MSAVRAAASPSALARAWAQAVVLHWDRVERLGGIDLAQPLYVIDLAPGDAGLALGMLDGLRDELLAHGMLGWPVRYLLCTPQADAAIPRLLAGPLRAHAERGWAQEARWRPRVGQPLLVGPRRIPLFGARNPIVALAADGRGAGVALADALRDFSAGRYLLLAVRRGDPGGFESGSARVADLSCGAADAVLHVACREDHVGLDDASWQGLLARARRDLNPHPHP